jgi:hypothetical protein
VKLLPTNTPFGATEFTASASPTLTGDAWAQVICGEGGRGTMLVSWPRAETQHLNVYGSSIGVNALILASDLDPVTVGGPTLQAAVLPGKSEQSGGTLSQQLVIPNGVATRVAIPPSSRRYTVGVEELPAANVRMIFRQLEVTGPSLVYTRQRDEDLLYDSTKNGVRSGLVSSAATHLEVTPVSADTAAKAITVTWQIGGPNER